MPDAWDLRKMINGVPVVTAPAEIDITTAGEFHAVLLEETSAGHRAVLVDMSRTLFCDASGLHTLLAAHRRAAAEGGELRLIIPAVRAAARVIYLTCVDHVIPLLSQPGRSPDPGPAAARHS